MRVVLQHPVEEDARELLALVRSSTKLHRGRTTPPSTPAAFTHWLARSRRPDTRVWLVRLEESGPAPIAGVVELSQIFLGNFRNAYLGYWAGEPFARRGVMTAGVSAALREAFGPLKLHRLEANIQPGNAASIALVRRLGFEREGYSPRYLKIAGRWRDHERWALRAEDWTARVKRKRAALTPPAKRARRRGSRPPA